MNPAPPRIPPRVRYSEGMLLDSTDFQDEQSYHRLRLSTVLARLHGFGTVAGLKVEAVKKGGALPDGTERAAEDVILVHPGLAVDRAGRLVEVPTPRTLRINRWFDGLSTGLPRTFALPSGSAGQRWFVADLFLRFVESRQGLRPTFPQPGVDATDGLSPSRLVDGFDLVLVPRSSPNGQEPPGPAPTFSSVPTTRQALLDAVFAAYSPPAPVEYPDPEDSAVPKNTPAAEAVMKLADKTAVFLARIRIRLLDETNPPQETLAPFASSEWTVDDKDRPLLPAAAMVLGLIRP